MADDTVMQEIKNLPDVSFIDNLTLSDLYSIAVNAFQNEYEKRTGRRKELSRSDPNRIILLAQAQLAYQALMKIDKAGKMNLLKYSYGDFLDNLGAYKGLLRHPESPAQVILRFSLEAPRTDITAIPKGTRATADSVVFFSTDEYAEIPAGETSVDVTATATEAGADGNNYAVGEIGTIVDTLPFIDSVENVNIPSNGHDQEDDDSFRERIYLAPEGYSVAGPNNAYIYYAKSADSLVGDVAVNSPKSGDVDITFLMVDGSLPSDMMLQKVLDYLSAKEKRPLTDHVHVLMPEVVKYTLDMTYYINESDSDAVKAKQKAIGQAVSDYILWQRTKLGRDINPDELVKRCVLAGAKRVEITSPTFTKITEASVAIPEGEISVKYGGIEDD